MARPGVVIGLLLCYATAGVGGTNTLGRDRGEYLSECFCYNESINEVCEGANDACIVYVKEVAQETWMVALFIAVLFWICFWRCGRTCCNTCGSKHISPGFCGGKAVFDSDTEESDTDGDDDDAEAGAMKDSSDRAPPAPFKGYSKRQRRGFRIALVMCWMTAVALISPGLEMNERFSEGVAGIGESLDEWMDGLVRVTDTVNYEFGRLPEAVAPDDLKKTINESTAAAVDALKLVRESKDVVMDADHGSGYSRKKLTIIAGAFLFFGATLVALMGCCGAYRRGAPGCVVSWLTTFHIFCLAICSIARILDCVTWDLCESYEPLTSDALDRISERLGCTEGSTDKLARIIIELEKVKTNFAEECCSVSEDMLCRVFPCSAGATMAPCLAANVSFAEVMEEMSAWKVADYLLIFPPLDTCEIPCTMDSCGATCGESVLKSALHYLASVRNVITIIELEVYPLAMCIPLYTLRDKIGVPFCTLMMPSIHDFFVLLCFVLFVYMISQIVVTLARKRFKYGARYAQPEPEKAATPAEDTVLTHHILVQPALITPAAQPLKHSPDREAAVPCKSPAHLPALEPAKVAVSPAASPALPPRDTREADDGNRLKGTPDARDNPLHPQGPRGRGGGRARTSRPNAPASKPGSTPPSPKALSHSASGGACTPPRSPPSPSETVAQVKSPGRTPPYPHTRTPPRTPPELALSQNRAPSARPPKVPAPSPASASLAATPSASPALLRPAAPRSPAPLSLASTLVPPQGAKKKRPPAPVARDAPPPDDEGEA